MRKIATKDNVSETKEFTDTLLTAYLDLCGYHVKPKTISAGQVAFEVTGEHLNDAIQAFYENPKVPLLNFCSSYKKVRSMIFNMKGNLR